MKERLLDVMKIGLIIIIVGIVFYVLTILLKTDPLTLFSTLLTALATIAIAIYAWMNYRLSLKIQSKDEEFRQHMGDLIKATVISNLLNPKFLPDSTKGEEILVYFNQMYDKVRSGESLFPDLRINK